MSSVERIFKGGKVWRVTYYPKRAAMTQLDHRTRSMSDRYKIVSDADMLRAL